MRRVVMLRNCETVTMRNVTVSADDDTCRLSRIRAAELGTSMSALVCGFLSDLVGGTADEVRSGALLGRRGRLLSEVVAVRSAGVGLRSVHDLSREAVYDGGRADTVARRGG